MEAVNWRRHRLNSLGWFMAKTATGLSPRRYTATKRRSAGRPSTMWT